MAGNTSKWRKSLAGLAAVATLATMGLVAGTASAVTSDGDATVKFDTLGQAGFSAASSKTVEKGFSLRDAWGTTDALSIGGSSSTKVFAGWLLNGALYDQNSAVTEDITLKAKYLDKDKATVVKFANQESSTRTYAVEQGSTVPAVFAPNDKADGKVVTGWNAVVTTPDTQNKEIKDFKLGETKLPDAATEVKLTPVYKDGKTLHFSFDQTKGDWVYADVKGIRGALSGGDATGSDLTFDVDVLEDSTYDPATVEARVVYGKQKDTSAYGVKEWNAAGKQYTNETKAKDAAATDGRVLATIGKAFTVTFKDGDKTLSEVPVVNGNKVAKPADPTRENSYFAGWKAKGENAWFDFDNRAITADTVIEAQWVYGGQRTITYKYNDGVTADKVEYYDGNQKTVKPADPTRTGYVFKGWYKDNGNGIYDSEDTEFTFGGVLGSEDVVLFAKWIQADQNVADLAFKYIDPAVDGYKDVFTSDSYAQYKTTYLALQKQYANDTAAAVAKGEKLSAEKASDYVNKLAEAWSKLVFKHSGTPTNRAVVYRLAKGDKHMYSSDQNEIKALTKTNSTSGNWVNEGAIFKVASPTGGYTQDLSHFANFNNEVKVVKDDKGNVVKDDKGNVVTTGADYSPLADFTEPLLVAVNRLYDPFQNEYLYTIDENEYTANQNGGMDGEGTAFFIPRHTENGRTVYRLAYGNKHLYSIDPNEVKVAQQYGWVNEGVAFVAYR